jgi:5'-nucleotidase
VTAESLETVADDIMELSDGIDFSWAEQIGAFWIEKVLREGMPRGSEILNVNIPNCPVRPEEYRYTSLDRQNYYIMKKPPARDRSKAFTIDFEIGFDRAMLKEDGDIACVCVERKTSVTPLGWDLTKR